MLGCALAAVAQPIVPAKDYSGFLRGNGYGWPDYAAPPTLGSLSLTTSNNAVVLEWTAAGILQGSSAVDRSWIDLPGATSPHTLPTTSAQSFYRLRGASSVHSGVGSGCPQQGFDFTGLPSDHWANRTASHDECGWIVPQALTGFADEVLDDAVVRVVLRSFHLPNDWAGWTGTCPTWEDDAIHQNEGWFHFRVRHPDPLGPLREHRLRFEICFDNPYAFPDGPLQLNQWWVDRTWDWEAHGVRHIFTPIFRVKTRAGAVGPWQHIAETNVHPTTDCLYDQRHYRCLFDQTLASTDWAEIEVAQNLPYTLEDRARLWQRIRTTYPARYSDLCVRKRHLGYSGLFATADAPPQTDGEFNELYAIEVFRKIPGSNDDPDLPNDRIVIVLAGVDYEPAGNFVAEGSLLEILDRWDTPDFEYRNLASYVVIPIGNPDGYEWGTCHAVPFGNGYAGATNGIHRGYIFLELESAVPDTALDPESRALRDYFRSLTAEGFDGRGGSIVTLLDYQNDLCPHPIRWQQTNAPGMFPSIYGYILTSDPAQYTNAVRTLGNLRRELLHPNTGRYVRDPASAQGWMSLPYVGYGIPLWITFEFEAAALYSTVNGPPGGWRGQFATPIQLPGASGDPTFYVHGYIDQIGQATAPDGDPAHVFKLFGRDIIDAVRRELLNAP